jgi:hypothetical protein
LSCRLKFMSLSAIEGLNLPSSTATNRSIVEPWAQSGTHQYNVTFWIDRAHQNVAGEHTEKRDSP